MKETLKRLSLFYYSKARFMWFFIMIASLMSVYAIWGYDQRREESLYVFIGLSCFACLKTNLLCSVWLLIRKKRVLKLAFLAFIVFWGILCFVNYISVTLYGFGIGRRLILVLFQTNLMEVKGFIPGMFHNIYTQVFSLRSALLLLVLCVVLKGLYTIPSKVFNTIILFAGFCGILYFGWYSLNRQFNRVSHFILPNLIVSIKSVLEDEKAFNKLVSNIHELPNAETASSDRLAKTVVLIIGESASSGHLSLYGYPLNTTPGFSSIADSLYVFVDAIGASASTGECVPKILSFQSDIPSEKKWYSFPSVFQLFHYWGYKTYWISNQDRTGNSGGTYSAIASSADYVKYVGIDNVNDHLSARYDEVVLPEVFDALSDSFNKLIVVHLFGSHTDYKDRYPKSKTKFGAKDVLKFNHNNWINANSASKIAQYDNSIFYTDSVLMEIF